MPTKVKSHAKSPNKAANRAKKSVNLPLQCAQKKPMSSQAAAAVAVNQARVGYTLNLRPTDVLALQTTMGNAAVQRLVKAQRARGQQSGGTMSPSGATIGTIQTTTVTGRTNTPGLIQRAPAGKALVVKKTHLRKPNRAGTALRKGPAIFNYVGRTIAKNKPIELLSATVKAGPNNIKWQKATHPDDPAVVGFVRMSKVLAKGPTGASGPATIAAPEKASDLEQAGKLSTILNDIINDGTGIGSSIGEMLSAKGKTEGDLAEVMLSKPEFRNRWCLLGMIDGIKKYKGSADLGEKVEAVLGTGGGLASIASGVTGALGKITGFVGDVVKHEGVKTAFGSIKEFFGFIGSGIDMVKGGVETVVKIVKAIGGGLKNKGKSAASRIRAFLETAGDIAGSALGTVKSAIEMVAGFLKMIKSVPLVSSILGIVGSVIDLVTGTLDLIKSVYDTVKLVLQIRKEKKLKDEMTKGEYETAKGVLGAKLVRMEQEAQPSGGTPALEKDKEGNITVKQQETTLAKYLLHTGKTPPVEKDAKDVQKHLMDQRLVSVVHKRIKRAYSRLPELIVDGTAAAISIIGGLVSIGADIAAVASAPTGIGTAAAVATKTIASTVTSVLSGSLKVGKAIYKIGRVGLRKIKQFARNKGWAGTNQEKTSKKKLARNKETTKGLLMEVATLDPSAPEFQTKATRTQLRLKATGVDMMALYEQNGEMGEQAKMIMEALKTRQ